MRSPHLEKETHFTLFILPLNKCSISESLRISQLLANVLLQKELSF